MQSGHRDKWPTSSISANRCACADGFELAKNELDCVQIMPVNLTQQNLDGNKNWSTLVSGQKYHYEMIVIHSADGERPEQQQQKTTTSAATSPSNKIDDQNIELDIKLLSGDDALGSSSSVAQKNEEPYRTSQQRIAATTTTTTRQPEQSATSSAMNKRREPARLSMSSLGKPCQLSRECQARDPNSHCVEGICECVSPSQRCRANATGCHPGTFQCRNGQCISWYFVCDRFSNCDDGSDEDECKPFSCPKEAFQCQSDGVCLGRAKICNGQRDCADNSDELYCGGGGGGGESLTSLAAALAVNSLMQTGSYGPAQWNSSSTTSDGKTGGGSRRRCHPNAFECASGQCLPAHVLCNSKEDCADGSDEREQLCERPACSHRKWAEAGLLGPSALSTGAKHADQRQHESAHQVVRLSHDSDAVGADPQHQNRHRPAPTDSPLVKASRDTIERLLASLTVAPVRTPDGPSRKRPAEPRRRTSRLEASLWTQQDRTSQLADPIGGVAAPIGSANFLTDQTNHNDECPRDAFTCHNGKCRSSAILCSGVDGCGDNSDESQCEVCQCDAPPPPSATT